MLQSGQNIAHFNVLKKLGEGGMGQVYLAEDQKLNRRVALKVLHGDAFDDESRLERFRREAKTAAQISHANVMGIYDIDSIKQPDSEADLNYIVMEYVEGESLSEHLRKHDPDMSSLVKTAEKIASGIAAAHKLNIVHRDIKADNIMISADGEPKVLDFGLAKSVETMFEGDDDTTRTVSGEELTRAGKILGTVSYMSPEQSRGEKIDTRSDIFSFGVLLYRMTTGEFPFAGPTSVSTLAKILEAKHEPPRLKNSNVHPELERIIDKCLSKDPNDRYQDTRDLVVDLRSLRRLYDSGTSDTISGEMTRPVTAVRSSGSRSKRFGIAMAVIVVLAALAIINGQFEKDSGGGGITPTVQANPNSLAILGFENKTGDVSLDWLETGLPEILLTDLAQAEGITIISRERIIDCFPDDKNADHTFDECVEAASSLGAVNLLSGSFYKLGEKIRIDARLQDVASGNVIAGEKVIGDDPFTLVDSLTQKIAASLNIHAKMANDRDVSTLMTSSPEAFRYYREGLEQMYVELYNDAIANFQKALEIDSTFALPYMRIGMSYQFQGMQQQGAIYFAKAKQYQDKLPPRDQALLEIYTDIWLEREFDRALIKMESFIKRYSGDKEGHAIYGLLVNVFTADTVTGLAHFDTALQIDPTYQLVLGTYLQFYSTRGNVEKAVEYAEQIKKYHPDSPSSYMALSNLYAGEGKFEEAIAEIDAFLARDKEYRPALYGKVNLHLSLRDIDGAEKAIEDLRQVIPEDDHFWLRRYYRRRGNISGWKGQFRQMKKDYLAGQSESVKTNDSSLIFSSLLSMALYEYRYGDYDSAVHYANQSDVWSGATSKVAYPLLAIKWDPGRKEELEPLIQSAITETKRRIPSELWAAIDELQTIFTAYADGDTAAVINIHKARVNETSTVVYGHGEELGVLQVLTGDYQAGKDNILEHYATNDNLTQCFHYMYSRYHLGIAEQGLGNDEAAIDYLEEVLRYWDNADVQIDMIKDARSRLASLTG